MIVVHKYGGSSLADLDKIKNIASHISKLSDAGEQIVVVASAMGKTTNKLIEMAKKISETPNIRELDSLMATGEQQTVALLSMALNELGKKSISLTGSQAGITTIGHHTKSRIKSVDPKIIISHLNRGKVVIVAGFQGMNQKGDITTLGRGGSDTSAVALAASLGARCEIYTDVDGIYSIDPRVYSDAKKIKYISYEEMMEMANLGAGIMETRAVELGKKYNVPIYVGESLRDHDGTLILNQDEIMEDKPITGITLNEDIFMVNIQHLPYSESLVAGIFNTLGKFELNIDMISQNITTAGTLDLSFSCFKREESLLKKAIEELKNKFEEISIEIKSDLIMISLVGIGMVSHSGVAAKVFNTLAENKIPFYHITTSEISISCTISKDHKKTATEMLAREFDL
ncbi:MULTISPECIES: aspartate kinase [Psychrilyobacter]|uniref:Aspartokinase n=1 Tax=Psychrilyobacter piezotolerans TaxID=2293438 RepID=A0ABX9KG44_9FUSO|nr:MULTISPECIES: aspartate kinase [Psychrilyobacter]MCS5422231.1 aspartate kinase [Psychrilyobacter sp. S5]NDI78268.1 aspartate kinase [Psychrilyobacter piezotolerans]RDE61174.1 aspartate kinase [Psychrilyobacter sp. S5]REI40842.1 aspartate kinase [Psychrilyobacter piezotolerans]